MRKRITVFVVLMMVVCLALAGCAQNTSKQEADRPGENFDTGDSSIMDGTNNSEGSPSEHEAITDTNDESIPDGAAEEAARNEGTAASDVDNRNPKQDADGMYIYEVRGHEIKLRTNIWDYIGKGETKNLFWNIALSKDLGYDEQYNYDGLYMNKNSDGSLVYVGFQHHTDNTCEVMTGTENGVVSSVRYASFDISQMEYVTDAAPYPVSLEFIILCTYALEYNQDNPGKDPFSSILADYKLSEHGSAYEFPYPIK